MNFLANAYRSFEVSSVRCFGTEKKNLLERISSSSRDAAIFCPVFSSNICILRLSISVFSFFQSPKFGFEFRRMCESRMCVDDE